MHTFFPICSLSLAFQEEGVNSDQLGLPNLGGVFIVLLGGMIASILLAFGEFVWENRLLAFTPGVSRERTRE